MKNKPIEQLLCCNCHMLTPAWRAHCIHCERPLANTPLRPPIKQQSTPAAVQS